MSEERHAPGKQGAKGTYADGENEKGIMKAAQQRQRDNHSPCGRHDTDYGHAFFVQATQRGGRITAAANEPRGAVFQFTLPGAEGNAPNMTAS